MGDEEEEEHEDEGEGEQGEEEEEDEEEEAEPLGNVIKSQQSVLSKTTHKALDPKNRDEEILHGLIHQRLFGELPEAGGFSLQSMASLTQSKVLSPGVSKNLSVQDKM